MPSIPLLSIPLYYTLALLPHAYALFVPGRPLLANRDNANPAGEPNLLALKKKLSPRAYAAYQRAERCHANALENMALFVTAIFAGLWAEREAGKGSVGLDTYAIGFLAVRVGYTVSYLFTERNAWSYVRTGLYNVGTLWSFAVIVRAAMKIA